MSQSINNGGDFRTAPTTPGLLKIISWLDSQGALEIIQPMSHFFRKGGGQGVWGYKKQSKSCKAKLNSNFVCKG